MPRVSGGNEGVGGFFEDIPTLIVVIIGFGIFLLSLVNAFVGYQIQQESFRMHQESVQFMEAIRTYDKFTYNSQEGVFLGDKVLQISENTIEKDFNPDTLGYEYRIIINDVSGYPDCDLYKVSFQTSSPPPEHSKFTAVSSVIVMVDEHYHSTQLIVTIWN